MKCRKARNLLSQNLDGRLSFEEERQLRQHMESCAACAAEYKGLRTTVDLVRALPQFKPQERFVEDLLERVRGLDEQGVAASGPSLWERIQTRLFPPGWSLSPQFAAAAVVVGLVVGIGGMMIIYQSPGGAARGGSSPAIATTAGSTDGREGVAPAPAREFEDLVDEMLRRAEATQAEELEGPEGPPSLDWGSAYDADAMGRQVGSGSQRETDRSDKERVTVVF